MRRVSIKSVEMAIIHLSSPHLSSLHFRQTPNGDGVWEDHQFILDDPDHKADWLVVYDRPAAALSTRVPKERRILMVSEPPEFQNYTQGFLDQFGTVYSPQALEMARDKSVEGQSALPWFYGMEVGGNDHGDISKNWDDLLAPTKTLDERQWELTAICSDKKQTKNQIRRLRFLKILKELLGDRLRIFGRGFEVLDDKAEVIESSQHHLVLENNLLPLGWTEKMADPVLGGSFPFHGGSEQISKDFDPAGLVWIDMTQPYASAQKILEFLDSRKAFTAEASQAMQANKQRLMQEHNLFAVIVALVQSKNAVGGVALSSNEDGKADAQMITWSKQPRWKRLFRKPKFINRLTWEIEVRLFERG